jgi:3-hydroxyacyl-[acyl-carrier-protein] dehydratase
MLQPDFYSFIRIVSNGSSSLEASFLLNPKHAIFAGHFPGQPVVPGVCMLQIIKEGLEQALDKKLVYKQILTLLGQAK